MRKILIEAVPPESMRLPYSGQEDGGDWYFDDGDMVIRVIGDDLAEPETFLIAVHELIEAALCRREGVPQEAVDAYDVMQGPWREGMPEPGDGLAAPYRTQHRRAMLIEHLLAMFMGITDYGRIE